MVLVVWYERGARPCRHRPRITGQAVASRTYPSVLAGCAAQRELRGGCAGDGSGRPSAGHYCVLLRSQRQRSSCGGLRKVSGYRFPPCELSGGGSGSGRPRRSSIGRQNQEKETGVSVVIRSDRISSTIFRTLGALGSSTTRIWITSRTMRCGRRPTMPWPIVWPAGGRRCLRILSTITRV